VENMATPLLLLIILSVYPVQTHVFNDALEWTDGRKFFCSTHRATWQNADSQCRAKGMSLAIVEDRSLMVAISNHCKFCCNCDAINSCNRKSKTDIHEPYPSAWVGGTRETNSNYYKWSNGHVIDEGDPIWLPLPNGKTEPNYYGTCLEICIWKNKLGLGDYPCRNLRKFVCEQRP